MTAFDVFRLNPVINRSIFRDYSSLLEVVPPATDTGLQSVLLGHYSYPPYPTIYIADNNVMATFQIVNNQPAQAVAEPEAASSN